MLQWLLLLQAATGTADPIAADPSAPSAAPPEACRVVDARSEQARQATPAGPANVYVACGTRAVRLGTAERYGSSYNAAIASIVVVLRTGEHTTVKLASPEADGTLHVDDVSRELTKLSGRYGATGLGAVDVDLKHFASDGSISVSSAANEQRGGEVQPAVKLDLTPYVSFMAKFSLTADRIRSASVPNIVDNINE